MLVLSRMVGETVRIGDLYAVTVLKISPETVHLLFQSGEGGLKLKSAQLARDQTMYVDSGGGWTDDRRKTVGAVGIEVTVVDIRDDKARLGVTSPKKLAVHRLEVWDAIQKENREAGGDDEGSAGARVPRPTQPNPPSLDVRLDEPKPDDDVT